ncbi:CAP domain-containing protein [Streptomyces roseoverticillatus]|uniref:CAP domain-containing protein n=1 Tax=Streptomyces roseoverticillatus TaxID=66429 RepID=UPI00340A0AFC
MTTPSCKRSVRRAAVSASVLTAVLSAAALLVAVPPVHAAVPAPRAGTAAPAADRPVSGAARQAYYPNVDRIVCEVNKERANRGLAALLISEPVSGVARSHARDMARMGRLTPTGSDGRDLRARLSDANVYSSHILEYLFYGYNHDGYFADMATDPDPNNDLYKGLMNRDTLAVGVGYENRYWDVVLVGKHRRLVTRPTSCGAA